MVTRGKSSGIRRPLNQRRRLLPVLCGGYSVLEACHLFGSTSRSKPSVPKRIKRHLARGRTALFGKEAEVRQLNQYDRVMRPSWRMGDLFSTAVYDPGPRCRKLDFGAALPLPRSCPANGHPVQIADLIQITGALPPAKSKPIA